LTLPLFPRASQRHRAPARLPRRPLLALLAASSSAACVKTLPPAPTPPAVIPRIDAAAPSGDAARLVVDVVEGPARVQRVRMAPRQAINAQGRPSVRFVETPEILCAATPCVADLPRGNILLGFPVLGDRDALETELVHVGPEPSVYRRSLSVREGGGALRVLGIIGTALGGTSVLTGATFLPIGLAKDNDALTLAGGITLGAGAALLAIGIWAIRHDAPTYRPGSSNHYPLAPSPSASNR
jgi:hypothetical protein